MPIHVNELTNDEPFPVKPETNEYKALSFLSANHAYGFTPSEIAANTDISNSSASKTMARLFKKGLVNRSDGVYYIEPDRAKLVSQRLESLDAAAQLFESTADDDAYAKAGWEDELPSIAQNEAGDATETQGQTTVDAKAEALISDLEDDSSENSSQ